MEKPTYTREQLKNLPAVVAKRRLDEDIKRAVNFITDNVIHEAKRGNTTYKHEIPTPPDIAEEIIKQLHNTFLSDVTMTHVDGYIVVVWS